MPYIKGTSERLQKSILIARGHSCPRAFIFIYCEQCDKEYVSETSRLLVTRVKELLSKNFSALHGHCQLTVHSVDSSKANKVLATESRRVNRCIKEATGIRLRKPSLNRVHGFELANIYDTDYAHLR